MGVVSTIDRRGRTHSPLTRYSDSSVDLRAHANSPDLSRGHCVIDRSSELSKADARSRQHAVLAQLVRAIEPHRAEQVAERLLADFGSLGQLLSASTISLANRCDNSILADVLPVARALVMEALCEEVRRVRFDPQDERVLTYIVSLLQAEPREHLHAIFLDGHYRFICEERIASGDWKQIEVQLRPLMRRAIELDSVNIVLVHNHPSGLCQPSDDDVVFTNEVARVANSLGINIFDHLIVAGPKAFSMRKANLL